MTIPTISFQNNLKIAQIANALYGSAVGATTNAAVLADIASVGYDATVNSYYTFSFGSMTAAAVAANMAANLGITAASVGADNVTVATDYIVAQLNAAPGAEGVAVTNILSMWSGMTADPIFGAAATTWNATIANAQAYTASGATADVAIANATAGAVYALTTGVEAMLGTAGADTFNAYILNNANTLQSGDVIDGGAGADTLFADIGNSQNFAITAETSNVENVTIRAQATPVDTANGNNMINSTVQIDAQRMAGVSKWESNGSRADVVIEDVRVNSNVSTIAFVESDPGHVDMAVYFNQNNLVNTTGGTSTLNILVMDTVAAGTAETAATPLLNHNFNTFAFYASDVLVTLGGAGTAAGAAIDAATTYAELLAAFQLALQTANVGGVVTDLSSDVTASLSAVQNMTTAAGSSAAAASFLNLNGQVLSLTTNTTMTISSTHSVTGAAGGWTAAGPAPTTGAIAQTMNTGSSSSAALVSTNIILDDVGMGSTGGDLIVGGMSVGETSASKGVEQFNIEVRDNSKLQTINSTNDTLREVYIVNGATSSTSTAYVTTTANAGDLTVNGNLSAVAGDNQLHAGLDAAHHDAYGFTDVRVIDGSAMTGKLAFTAQVTTASIAKYVNLVDTANSPTADVATAQTVGKGANFLYTGGANNDTMNVLIDSAVAASSTLTGQSDFTFNISGGNGNDVITTNIGGTETSAWLADQQSLNNITVSGGAGNDTITTTGAGNVAISAGAGNDVVFADNSGTISTTWTVNNTAAAVLSDMQTNGGFSAFLYKGQLTVSFSGAGSTGVGGGVTAAAADSAATPFTNGYEVTVDIPTGTNFAVTQYYVNQAIKNAINNDAVLSKLLTATDGPADTLKITSKIDGAFNANDLSLTVSSSYVPGTASEDATVLSAYQAYVKDSDALQAAATAANTASVGTANLVTGMSAAANGAGSVLGGTVAALAGIATESSVVTFTLGATVIAGNTIIIDGTTTNLVDTDVSGAVDLAEIVAQVAAGTPTAGGNWTVTASDGVAGTVTFTSTVAGSNVADLNTAAITGTAAASAVAVVSQGSAGALAVTGVTGTISAADSDNTIDMGAGSDLAVLGTGAASQDTLVFTGTGIDTTVVNFTDAAGANMDKLNFTSYLVDKDSSSGSTVSQARIATTLDADATLTTNEVAVISTAVFTTTDTFAGLTGAKLLSAVNTAGNVAYAGLGDAALDATFNLGATALVGGTAHSVVMVENDANQGEYAMFELSWTATAAGDIDFDAATLIGVVDFGNSLTLATANLV